MMATSAITIPNFAPSFTALCSVFVEARLTHSDMAAYASNAVQDPTTLVSPPFLMLAGNRKTPNAITASVTAIPI